MADETIRYMFLLSALLIVTAYFVGAATDLNALINGLVKIGYVFSGRTTTGAVSGYAPNAPNGGKVQ